jgi:hypothetical protein
MLKIGVVGYGTGGQNIHTPFIVARACDRRQGQGGLTGHADSCQPDRHDRRRGL